MKTFFRLLATALVVVTTTNFVWFALVFWAFLSTKSVISTSTMGGIYLVLMAVSGIWFGSIVDHHRKKHVMLGSSVATLLAFAAGLAVLRFAPAGAFATVASPWLWLLVVILLCGAIAGTIYNIAIPTLIGLTVPEERRDRANGMFGTVVGIAFGITSVASGVALAELGMQWVLGIAIAATLVAIAMLALIPIEEREIVHLTEGSGNKVDLRGTVAVVRVIPGLFPLIFFTTFNNFLGGVFMALMDAYGLSLVSVQVWGSCGASSASASSWAACSSRSAGWEATRCGRSSASTSSSGRCASSSRSSIPSCCSRSGPSSGCSSFRSSKRSSRRSFRKSCRPSAWGASSASRTASNSRHRRSRLS